MYKTLCVTTIFVVIGAFAPLAQSVGDPALLSSGASAVLPEAVKNIAPTGKLRAAINAGNVVLVQRDPTGGEPHGITVDLARELARRLGVPIELVVFETAGKVTDAVKAGRWDVAFIAIEPVRASVIDFTAPYVIIEGTYMVPADSSLKDIADVDRPGVRIAVAKGSAYDLYLTRTLKSATLVHYPTPSLAFAGFISDKLEVAAGVKQQLIQFVKKNPKLRVMDGRFQEIKEAMGTPLGRKMGIQYLQKFVEEMKATGFVARALERSNQPDAVIAPPAEN
jgi:polar amino acid transport system substrate-binding protein